MKWTCNACGESGEGSNFRQCWTMPLVGHGWPEDSLHHWPSGLPASADEARFFSAVRERQEADPVTAHEPQVIEGYVDPSGRGEGNWSSEK